MQQGTKSPAGALDLLKFFAAERRERAKSAVANHAASIRPAFIEAWIWVVAHAFRAFSIPVMLASRENQNLSVLLWGYWDAERNFSAAAALGVVLTILLTFMTLSPFKP